MALALLAVIASLFVGQCSGAGNDTIFTKLGTVQGDQVNFDGTAVRRYKGTQFYIYSL